MRTLRILGIPAALAAACLVTLGLCVLMPMLSGEVAFKAGQTYSDPIRIARVMPPPKRKKPEERPPEKKPKPKKIKPKQFTAQKQHRPPTPELQMPRLSFDPAPSDTATVSVPAPTGGGFSGTAAAAGFSLGEVDTPPRLVRYIPPLYPTMAKRRRIEGKVLLRALITTEGKAEQISVVSAEPEGIFEEVAQKALSRWTFRPGILEGKEVPTWIEIPVAFTLNR